MPSPPYRLLMPEGSELITLLANGIAPQTQAEVAEEQQQIALDSILSPVSANWFLLKSKSVPPDYAKDIQRSLEKDVFLAIGEIPVQQIKAQTLVEALEPIKTRGALETVRRLVQRINEIMIYAVNTGLIEWQLLTLVPLQWPPVLGGLRSISKQTSGLFPPSA